MALKKTVQTVHGIEVKDAYHRVEGVQISGKNNIKFQVRTSVNGVMPHFKDTTYECTYDINGTNPIAQAYKHIKTVSEFSGAEDC
jgi:hypothetical protein